jgi:hypothetical protein
MAWAAPGDLDPAFGVDGVVTTEIPGGSGAWQLWRRMLKGERFCRSGQLIG